MEGDGDADEGGEEGMRAEKKRMGEETERMMAEKERVDKERDEARQETKREMEVLRAMLAEFTKNEVEREGMNMGDTDSPSQKTMVDAAANTEKRTYAQAAAQTQAEKREEKGKGKENKKEAWGKGKGTSQTPPGSEQGAGLPQRFPFVGDMSEYEEEEAGKQGTMTKAVVVHGVSTNWRVNGVADCMERITGRVIGVRWLLGVGRRVGRQPHRWLSTWIGKSSWERRHLLRWRGRGTPLFRTSGGPDRFGFCVAMLYRRFGGFT